MHASFVSSVLLIATLVTRREKKSNELYEHLFSFSLQHYIYTITSTLSTFSHG